MKKSIAIFLSILDILIITLLGLLVEDKILVNKITIFLSAILSLLISYIIGVTKGRYGLLNGLIVGISIASVSTLIHFLFAKEFFSFLYLRVSAIILSAASGGVYGVNKKHPEI